MKKFLCLSALFLFVLGASNAFSQESFDNDTIAFELPADWTVTETNFEEAADLCSVKAESGECSFAVFGYSGKTEDPEDVFYFYFDKIIDMDDVYFSFKGIEKKTIGDYEYYLTEFEYKFTNSSPEVRYKGFAYVTYPDENSSYLIIELENWRFKRKCETAYQAMKESLKIKN